LKKSPLRLALFVKQKSFEARPGANEANEVCRECRAKKYVALQLLTA